jgi:hypothetical protein
MSEPEASPAAEPVPAVQVDHAENVNVPATGGALPHAAAIIAITFMILLAFVVVTFWVLTASEGSGIDAATKGAVIQTWNNLAIGAAGFWVGSSLAGKMAAGANRMP